MNFLEALYITPYTLIRDENRFPTNIIIIMSTVTTSGRCSYFLSYTSEIAIHSYCIALLIIINTRVK